MGSTQVQNGVIIGSNRFLMQPSLQSELRPSKCRSDHRSIFFRSGTARLELQDNCIPIINTSSFPLIKFLYKFQNEFHCAHSFCFFAFCICFQSKILHGIDWSWFRSSENFPFVELKLAITHNSRKFKLKKFRFLPEQITEKWRKCIEVKGDRW